MSSQVFEAMCRIVGGTFPHIPVHNAFNFCQRSKIYFFTFSSKNYLPTQPSCLRGLLNRPSCSLLSQSHSTLEPTGQTFDFLDISDFKQDQQLFIWILQVSYSKQCFYFEIKGGLPPLLLSKRLTFSDYPV